MNVGSSGNDASATGYNQGRWSEEEHDKFLEALHKYGRNWNAVHEHVVTRNSAQARSHAQKFLNKLSKQEKT